MDKQKTKKQYVASISIFFTLVLSCLALIGVLAYFTFFESDSPDEPQITITTISEPVQPEQEPSTAVAEPLSPDVLLSRVNQEREKIGVGPLSIDENVQKSAQLKADDMIARNYRSHYLPEDPTSTLTYEMYSYINPVCSESSENYTYKVNPDLQHTPGSAMKSWLNSPPHKAAMLDPKYTKTGFGISGSVVVQKFCVAR